MGAESESHQTPSALADPRPPGDVFAGNEGDGGVPVYLRGGSDRRWCCLAREGSQSSSETFVINRSLRVG